MPFKSFSVTPCLWANQGRDVQMDVFVKGRDVQMDVLSAACCTEMRVANDKSEICAPPKKIEGKKFFQLQQEAEQWEKARGWNLTNFLAFNQMRQGRGCRICFLSHGSWSGKKTTETCINLLTFLVHWEIKSPYSPFLFLNPCAPSLLLPVLCFHSRVLIFCAIYYIYKWFYQALRFVHAAVLPFFCFDIVYIIYKCTFVCFCFFVLFS